MKKLVVCMKWGARYGADYVNRLHRGVVRGMGATPFEMVCFTDDASGVAEGVRCVALPAFAGVPEHLSVKPWKKISLWQKSLGRGLDGRDALFLDLDVVITGDLAPLFDYEPGKYVVWENPTKRGSGIGNTSVFRFKVGAHPEVYDYFMADPQGVYEKAFRIEQEMISAILGDRVGLEEKGLPPVPYSDSPSGSPHLSANRNGNLDEALRAGLRSEVGTATTDFSGIFGQGEQRFWPEGWCCSFKEDLLPGWPMRFWQEVRLPEGCRIVVFHGKPDPDEARDGKWPARGWKRLYKYVRPVRWIGQYWG